MFSYRSKGLLQLYMLCTTVLLGAFFLALAAGTRVVPHFIELSPDIKLRFFFLLVVGGMAVSGRFLPAIGWRFHDMGWPEAAWLGTRQILTVALFLFMGIVATKDRSMSRIFLGVFLMLGWVLLVIVNRRVPRFMCAIMFGGGNRLPTLFVGDGRALRELDSWVARRRHLGILPVGHLSDMPHAATAAALGPHLGRVEDLARTVSELNAGQVILAGVPERKEEMRTAIMACQAAGCRLLIHDDTADRLPVNMVPIAEDGRFFFTLQTEPLEDPVSRAVKRAFDIALSLPVTVLILPPLCLWVAVMQAIQSPGPLFFVRPRGGRMRTAFQMIKFRTMRWETPDKAREAVQAREGDERIFRFGQFLRRSSLDEFPQFWNVLKGEMSIVGPRPHLLSHDDAFSRIANLYRTRHLVKPGITGLAQIRGYRGEITDPALLEQRVDLDITYITRWSIWLDLQITLKTLLHVLFPPKSAY